MQIDRRITNSLAWAGVVLIIGMPLADLVSAQLMGDAADTRPAQVAMIEPVVFVASVPAALSQRPTAPRPKPVAAIETTQSVAPAKPASAPAPIVAVQTTAALPIASGARTPNDVVDSYLKAGKALPSYIIGSPATPVTTQSVVPAQVPPPATDPIKVAALTPAKIAPIPMPLSMRPQPVLIVQGAARSQTIQVRPSANPRSSASVTYGDLQDWESGPLSEFLAKWRADSAVDADYDPDGFFLNEGPNDPQRWNRMIGPAEQLFFPFAN
ncbi:MAG: hypothetical protein MO846_01640 [Candidatus Devosia symbiotica]|nr:hypothetical protein [Candidatus Devosia symbiotica]